MRDYPSKRDSQDSSNDSSENSDEDSDDWAEYRNILFLKHIGFSLDEIRQMTMTQFMVMTDLYTGANKSDSSTQQQQHENTPAPVTRKATQADIDRLFSF